MTHFLFAPLLALMLLMPQEAPQAPEVIKSGTAAPVLTTEQKLALTNIRQQLEIAQLKAQAAQRDFDSARSDLLASMKALHKEGFTLDVVKLEYVKETPVKIDPVK